MAQFLTFLLIMQSSDVLGVLLNYAAVSFIATIDDRVFYLGKRGWFGRDVERQVCLVCLADDPTPKQVWYHRLAHTLSLAVIFGCLVSAWVVVVSRQTSGTYLPQTIEVQFSDAVSPSFGPFSGLYDIFYERDRIFSSDRSVYSERRSRLAHFGYCESVQAWTFGYNVTADEFDACDWAARSSTTETFDIMTTATSQWFGKNKIGRVIPMEALISPFDCEKNDGLCGSHGYCTSNNECICEDGWVSDDWLSYPF